MIELGYALSSEEHEPNELIVHAQMAEDSGFQFLLVSDHFHPWVPRQGQSPFVWRPRYGMVKVCWATSKEKSEEVMKQWWPVSAISGPLHADLPTPSHFQDVVDAMGEPKLPDDAVLGPDLAPYLEAIQAMQENGFDHIYLHQIGPDQEGFLKFFKSELLPLLEKEALVEVQV